jgi:hypothetical protein
MGIVFPDLTTVQLVTGRIGEWQPLRLAGVVFEARLRARANNDYVLAPFISDSHGVVRFTRERCEALVEAEHDSGLMDFAGLENCDAPAEVRHLSGTEVRKAADIRRRVWTRLLRGEDRLFSSINELIAIYQNAPNERIRARDGTLYPRWEGGDSKRDFTYVVDLVAPA